MLHPKYAKRVYRNSLGLKEYETVLIITDEKMRKIGRAFFKAARELGNEAVYAEMVSRSIDGEEPPKIISDAMKKADVIVLVTRRSLSHTKARRDANKKGARIASMPGVTEGMLERNYYADYRKIRKRTKAIAQYLNNAKNVRIQTDAGTNISMSLEGRGHGNIFSGLYRRKGIRGNVPAGEARLAPVEKTAEGVFVVDASMAGIGKVRSPITITVEKGYATKIEGKKDAEKLKRMLQGKPKAAYNIGELGIGTNDKAEISGRVLEDEKVLGTAHLALGDSTSFGGKVKTSTHLDGVFMDPTIWVDEKMVMDKGKLLVFD